MGTRFYREESSRRVIFAEAWNDDFKSVETRYPVFVEVDERDLPEPLNTPEKRATSELIPVDGGTDGDCHWLVYYWCD